MMLGLRLLDHGVDTLAFQERHGVNLDDAFSPTVDELIGIGMLERHKSGLRLTPRGLMLANDVVARFL
jgi:oxygen-independent coproporphyrinogen-3 oxidase